MTASGCSRVSASSSVVPAVMAYAAQSCSVLRAIAMPLAMVTPIETGASACSNVSRQAAPAGAMPQPGRGVGEQRRWPEHGDECHQATGDARRPLTDQHDDHRTGRYRARDREHVEELARREPVVDLHRLALHVRQHRRPATERQQRQQAEHRGDLQQRAGHRARSTKVTSEARRQHRPAAPRAAGRAGCRYRRRWPRRPAPARCGGCCGCASRMPVAMLKPMAAAPAPARAALSSRPPGAAMRGEIQAAEAEQDRQRHQQQPGDRGDRAGDAAKLRADDHREVHVGGARHQLGEPEAGQELRVIDPAAPFHQLATDPSHQPTAEAGRPDGEETEEQGGKAGWWPRIWRCPTERRRNGRGNAAICHPAIQPRPV